MTDSTPTPAQSLEVPFAVPVRTCARTVDSAGIYDASGEWICSGPTIYIVDVAAAINAHFAPAPTAPGESDVTTLAHALDERDIAVDLLEIKTRRLNEIADERDALREQLAELERHRDAGWTKAANNERAGFIRGFREGWMRCGSYHVDVCFESPEEEANVQRRLDEHFAALPASADEGNDRG